MTRKLGYLACLACSLFASATFAMPREVVIIRHADVLDQKEAGIGLSAKGYVRANTFAHYFVKNFGAPDVIITSKPRDDADKDTSIRELQTLAPLANLLAEQNPDANPEKDFPVLFKYENDKYKDLVNKLKKDNDFNDKLVVICWDRKKMDNIARDLGAPGAESPADDEYDTVFDIKFDHDGNVTDFQSLKDQYPVNFNGTWEDLHILAN